MKHREILGSFQYLIPSGTSLTSEFKEYFSHLIILIKIFTNGLNMTHGSRDTVTQHIYLQPEWTSFRIETKP